MFSTRLIVNGFGGVIGATFGAGGVYASASIRSYSFGRYTINMSSA
jgi:hypothetical protein